VSILLFWNCKRAKETEEAISYFERLDPIKASHFQPLVVGGPTEKTYYRMEMPLQYTQQVKTKEHNL
jgi:hypothetical protein